VTEAVLIVDRWSSECGACGRSANPREETHATLLGYGEQNGKPGCGARFTSIRSAGFYPGDKEATMAVRPDLPWAGHDS
jgi:hypothetical protein